MKKGSIQKLSILGVVLMGASAVTAWVMPSSKPAFAANGILDNSVGAAGAQQTCKLAVSGTPNCDFTATDDNLSFTSAEGVITSDAGVSTGAVNTGLINHGNGIRVTT